MCFIGGCGDRLLVCNISLFSHKIKLIPYPDEAGWLVSDGQHRLIDNDVNGSASKPTGKLVLRLGLVKLLGNSIWPSTNGYIGCKHKMGTIYCEACLSWRTESLLLRCSRKDIYRMSAVSGGGCCCRGSCCYVHTRIVAQLFWITKNDRFDDAFDVLVRPNTE